MYNKRPIWFSRLRERGGRDFRRFETIARIIFSITVVGAVRSHSRRRSQPTFDEGATTLKEVKAHLKTARIFVTHCIYRLPPWNGHLGRRLAFHRWKLSQALWNEDDNTRPLHTIRACTCVRVTYIRTGIVQERPSGPSSMCSIAHCLHTYIHTSMKN